MFCKEAKSKEKSKLKNFVLCFRYYLDLQHRVEMSRRHNYTHENRSRLGDISKYNIEESNSQSWVSRLIKIPRYFQG